MTKHTRKRLHAGEYDSHVNYLAYPSPAFPSLKMSIGPQLPHSAA